MAGIQWPSVVFSGGTVYSGGQYAGTYTGSGAVYWGTGAATPSEAQKLGIAEKVYGVPVSEMKVAAERIGEETNPVTRAYLLAKYQEKYGQYLTPEKQAELEGTYKQYSAQAVEYRTQQARAEQQRISGLVYAGQPSEIYGQSVVSMTPKEPITYTPEGKVVLKLGDLPDIRNIIWTIPESRLQTPTVDIPTRSTVTNYVPASAMSATEYKNILLENALIGREQIARQEAGLRTLEQTISKQPADSMFLIDGREVTQAEAFKAIETGIATQAGAGAAMGEYIKTINTIPASDILAMKRTGLAMQRAESMVRNEPIAAGMATLFAPDYAAFKYGYSLIQPHSNYLTEMFGKSESSQKVLTEITAETIGHGQYTDWGRISTSVAGSAAITWTEWMIGGAVVKDVLVGVAPYVAESYAVSKVTPSLLGDIGKAATFLSAHETGAFMVGASIYGTMEAQKLVSMREGGISGERIFASVGSDVERFAAGAIGFGMGLRTGTDIRFIGKTYIPEERFVQPDVLSGEKTFPTTEGAGTTKGAQVLIKEFESGEYKFYTPVDIGEGNVPQAWHAVGDLGRYSQDILIVKSRPLAELHAMDVGSMSASPSLSPHFLGTGYPPLTSWGFGITEPKAIAIVGGDIGRIPEEVRAGGLEAMRNWLNTEAVSSGKMVVAPSFELGKTESEIKIPVGTLLERLGKGFKYYTSAEGVLVPIYPVLVQPTGSVNIEMALQSGKTIGTIGSSSEVQSSRYNIASLFLSSESISSMPSEPSVPSMPSIPSVMSLKSVPSRPSYPSVPFEPSFISPKSTPSYPSAPSIPSIPSEPSVPSYPSKPSVPTIFEPLPVPIPLTDYPNIEKKKFEKKKIKFGQVQKAREWKFKKNIVWG